MSKLLRQKTILALLSEGPIASQEDLQRSLHKHGVRVGQATLSRDIREMGLAKTAEGYTLPSENASGSVLPPVSRLMREFVVDVRRAQNLLVIKTTVGSAQPVCAALDDQEWPEAVGSVAGDDTILIVCPDRKAATRLELRAQEMLA